MSYSILINGRPRGKFKGFKGLRQGDPLSPFLFTVVANGLSRLMDKATKIGFVNIWRVGRDNVMVSHLQFADDTIFFSGVQGRLFQESVNSVGFVLLCFRFKNKHG